MQIDQKMLNRILSMNDQQLTNLIGQIAAEIGVPPESIGLDPNNLQSIRDNLSHASRQDLEQLNSIYNEYRQSSRRKG